MRSGCVDFTPCDDYFVFTLSNYFQNDEEDLLALIDNDPHEKQLRLSDVCTLDEMSVSDRGNFIIVKFFSSSGNTLEIIDNQDAKNLYQLFFYCM